MENKEYYALLDSDTWKFIATWYGSESLTDLTIAYIEEMKDELREVAKIEGYRNVDEYIFNLSEKDILTIISSTSLVVTSLTEEELSENTPV